MNHKLLESLKKSAQLPSLPAVAVRVLELAKQQNVKMNDMAKVISSDPALSAKVIKTVNSSFYGLPNQVSTVNHALVLLGMQSVKTLALGFSLASGLNANKSAAFDYTRFWRQSLYSAVAARNLGKSISSGQHEEAFLAGLLSDIGTLVMHRVLGAEYDALLEACDGNQIELVRLSREKFDLDHAQVGGMLAEQWKLPPILVEPIRRHHDLENRTTRGDLVDVVHAAVLCGQVFAAKVPGLLEQAKKELADRFNQSETRIHDFFVETDSQATELAELFELNLEAGHSYQDIEEEARETLMELTLQTQIQSQQVSEQNVQLQQQATTDALTGLANRARFDQFIHDAFAESVRLSRPLSVLFLDVDKFKSINDTRGHQAGDAVLKFLGMLLNSKVSETDLAARYGGEEMAVVLSGKGADSALQTAEEIRLAIMKAVITFDGKTIPVTTSIGVATTDAVHAFSSPMELVSAADRAVYAAKGSGRNCVRFSPPPARSNAA